MKEYIFQQLSADTLDFLWQEKDHLSPSAEIPLSFPSFVRIPSEKIRKFSFNFSELCICQCCPPYNYEDILKAAKETYCRLK